MVIETPPIPKDMLELMKALAKQVIKEKPDNIYEFSAKFFEGLLIERDGSLDKGYGKFRSYDKYCAFIDKMNKKVPPKSIGPSRTNHHGSLDSGVGSGGVTSSGERPTSSVSTASSVGTTGVGADCTQPLEVNGVAIKAVPRQTTTKTTKKSMNVSAHLLDNSLCSEEETNLDTTRVDPAEHNISQKVLRKHSSKKPADNLIVIAEETSSDVADANEIMRQTLAAVLIQRSFRRVLAQVRERTERKAAETIQKAYKSFVSRKIASELCEVDEKPIHPQIGDYPKHIDSSKNLNKPEANFADEYLFVSNLSEKNTEAESEITMHVPLNAGKTLSASSLDISDNKSEEPIDQEDILIQPKQKTTDLIVNSLAISNTIEENTLSIDESQNQIVHDSTDLIDDSTDLMTEILEDAVALNSHKSNDDLSNIISASIEKPSNLNIKLVEATSEGDDELCKESSNNNKDSTTLEENIKISDSFLELSDQSPREFVTDDDDTIDEMSSEQSLSARSVNSKVDVFRENEEVVNNQICTLPIESKVNDAEGSNIILEENKAENIELNLEEIRERNSISTFDLTPNLNENTTLDSITSIPSEQYSLAQINEEETPTDLSQISQLEITDTIDANEPQSLKKSKTVLRDLQHLKELNVVDTSAYSNLVVNNNETEQIPSTSDPPSSPESVSRASSALTPESQTESYDIITVIENTIIPDIHHTKETDETEVIAADSNINSQTEVLNEIQELDVTKKPEQNPVLNITDKVKPISGGEPFTTIDSDIDKNIKEMQRSGVTIDCQDKDNVLVNKNEFKLTADNDPKVMIPVILEKEEETHTELKSCIQEQEIQPPDDDAKSIFKNSEENVKFDMKMNNIELSDSFTDSTTPDSNVDFNKTPILTNLEQIRETQLSLVEDNLVTPDEHRETTLPDKFNIYPDDTLQSTNNADSLHINNSNKSAPDQQGASEEAKTTISHIEMSQNKTVEHSLEDSESDNSSDEQKTSAGAVPTNETTNTAFPYEPLFSSDLSESDDVDVVRFGDSGVDETSRDEMDELSEVENFDLTSCGEDSLEAMYYRIRKSEIMLDKSKKSKSMVESRKENAFEDHGISEQATTDSTTDTNIAHEEHGVSEQATTTEVSNDEEYIALTNNDNPDVSKDENNTMPLNPVEFAIEQQKKLVQNLHHRGSVTYEDVVTPLGDGEEDDQYPDCLDIRRKMWASSVSETDSDYVDLSHHRLTRDDFNISTALDHVTSSDSDSTIVSAATKIQAGARGFLTRRRLRRSSAGTSAASAEKTCSFGNAAIDKSLEDLIEQQEQLTMDEAVVKVQRFYRMYRKKVRAAEKQQRLINAHLCDDSQCVGVDGDDDAEPVSEVIDVKLEQKKTGLDVFNPNMNDANASSSKDIKTNLNKETSGDENRHTICSEESVSKQDMASSPNDVLEPLKIDPTDAQRSRSPANHLSIASSAGETFGLDITQRRMTLQRGDAVQRHSTLEEPSSGAAETTPKSLGIPSKLIGSNQLNYKKSNSLLGLRQNSMPVQIDSDFIRIIPKHLRKRIKSAGSTKSDTSKQSKAHKFG